MCFRNKRFERGRTMEAFTIVLVNARKGNVGDYSAYRLQKDFKPVGLN